MPVEGHARQWQAASAFVGRFQIEVVVPMGQARDVYTDRHNKREESTMRRRDLLKAAPALMAPALARAEARPLRYIPNSGLSTIDPIWTTASRPALY